MRTNGLLRRTIVKQNQIVLVKMEEYIGFCVHRRSYLLWSPVIVSAYSFDTLRSAVVQKPVHTKAATSIVARVESGKNNPR